MTISFAQNIAVLKAQRALGTATHSVSKTSERLASGMRINNASDDAAGLAIAEKLSVSARLYTQANRNINDGLSQLNIIDGALSELSTIVTRIQELSEQSANGTYSNKQREALDEEAQALRKEFNRIVSSTSYNGVNLIDNSSDGFTIQAGTGSDKNSQLKVNVGAALDRRVGTGEFTYSAQLAATGRAYTVELADFNGDGKLDIAYGSDTGGAFYLKVGAGDGSFGPDLALGIASTSALIQGDFNGDGRIDLVRSRFDGIKINLNTTGTAFSESAVSPVAGLNLSVVDMNNDGKLDITGRNSAGDEFYVFKGNGDGTFQAAMVTTFNTAVTSTYAIADFNGDGINDVISGDIFSTSLYLGRGDGSFTASTVLNGTPGTPTGFTAADFNNDGNMDFSFTNPGGTSNVVLGDGRGGFSAPTALSGPINGISMAAFDLNEDGNMDLMVSGQTGSFTTWMGKGDGSFSAGVSTSGGTSTHLTDFAIGDVNGDGVNDVVTPTYTGQTLNVFIGTGQDTSNLYNFDISTQGGARSTLTLMGNVQEQLGLTRASVGAAQSRLMTAQNTALAASESLTAARSRIVDADVAEESANLLRQKILQQAAVSILGHAKQDPALVLALLKPN